VAPNEKKRESREELASKNIVQQMQYTIHDEDQLHKRFPLTGDRSKLGDNHNIKISLSNIF
jgi:hypothetical protein